MNKKKSASDAGTSVTLQGEIYFSADIETDGPIPGPYSMLSFALVPVATFDGECFKRIPRSARFAAELRPISTRFDEEALAVNNIDRSRLLREGREPAEVMTAATEWVNRIAAGIRPVLVAYPVAFDWSWLYWYFVRYSATGSPFSHSAAYDIKTAFAVKAGLPLSLAGRSRMPAFLRKGLSHTHEALDDAVEQGEIFARLFEWKGKSETDASYVLSPRSKKSDKRQTAG
jgi:hypothetical protein